MPVYVIIEITVIDEAMYTEYVDRVYDVIIHHGGRYLVRGGSSQTLSGNWHPERLVVIAFPNRESVYLCFGSTAYQQLAPLQEQSTTSRAIVVDGVNEIT